ncbi:MAG: glutaredoxin family protein [Anaerolineae bacterium]|nr:glutaredoxin family protein [Anaerolineae bacterium]
MINVTLYTREDCHLCEQVKTELATLQKEYPHKVVEIDVDSDESLKEKFGDSVPVVEIGPYRRTAPITRQDLIISLGAAKDREVQLEKLKDPIHEARKKNPRLQEITARIEFHIGYLINIFGSSTLLFFFMWVWHSSHLY